MAKSPRPMPAIVQRLRRSEYTVRADGRGFTVHADGELIGKGLSQSDLRRLEKDGAAEFRAARGSGDALTRALKGR